jgi:hypothetical protein
MRSPSAIRREPSQAWTHTQRISGRTSQWPSGRTPPQGPLRICFGQFIGQDMPVELSTHCPHIRQSKRSPFTFRSAAANAGPSRSCPARRSSGAAATSSSSKRR